MKMLLAAVNAKYIHSNPAVYGLRAYAGQYKEHIEIAEYTINHRTEAILADLYKRGPQAIAFSCYIWNWNIVRELLAELPKVMPDTDIWLGGPEVSHNVIVIVEKYPWLTGVMVGEGEETFLELMEHYCAGDKELAEIKGLWLPGTGFTGERMPVDIDRIPFFYEDVSTFENRIIYYETSRGCPYRCSYCMSSIEKGVRLRSLSKVKRELAFFLEHRVPQVKFIDRTFNCVHEHAMAIWRFLLENDNGVTNFHFEISADILTGEELTILRGMRPGLMQLEIGVQSVNPDTLREIRRVMDPGRLENAVKYIREGNNIHIHLDLIAGLPYETYDSFINSFNRVYHMEPDQLQLGFLKVLKGSYMYEKADDYGIGYRSLPPYEVLYSDWISYEELLKLKQVEEMVELYYNSGQFRHTLKILVRAFENPFQLYERLARYYEQKGYFINSPARVYRYQVLLSFAESADGDRSALYRELLTYDLYLRENCKSRPAFARDLSPYKKELKRREGDKKDHLDVFYYPVWEKEAEKIEKCQNSPIIVRFCYEKRNPISHDAQVEVKVEG